MKLFDRDSEQNLLKKIWKKFSKILVIAAVILLIASIYTLVSEKNFKNDPFVIDSAINSIGELATSEYNYTMIQTSEKPKREVFGFAIPLTASKVVYSYSGLIKAGVDFTQIKADINKAARTITFTMPETKILSSEVKYDSLRVFDENNNPFNAFTFEDMNLSVSDLQQKAEQSAIDNGLLVSAYENAKTVIQSAISGLYNTNEYILVFN